MDGSWLVGGDFNVIAHNGERTGRNTHDRGTSDFAVMMMDCSLTDADHSPLLIQWSFDDDLGPRPFRFLNVWSRHHDFLSFVFGDIFQRVGDAESSVDEAELDYDSDLIPAHRDSLHHAQAVLNRTLSIEEAFWKQKAGGSVDDMIIFSNGQKQSIRRVLHCIEHYERASSQLVNRDKSGIILPRRSSINQIHRLEHLTGFRHQHQPFTYLGVSLFTGACKIFLYDDLIQKVRSRISGWASRLLSPRGRITLIRSVLSSLLLYLLQIMKPPKAVLKKLESIFARFLWDSRDHTHRLHWRRWKDLCLPTEEGGLGFMRLQDLVDTFSLKLWLKHIGPQVESNIAWKLGHGHIFFWHDCWMGNSTLAVRLPQMTHSSVQVHDLFDYTGWNIDRLIQMVPQYIAEQIGSIPITAQRLWQNLIPIDVVIQRRVGSHMASKCQCCSATETIQHLFIDSPIAVHVWEHFYDIFHITLRPLESFQYRFQAWRFSGQFVRQGHIRTIVPILILWYIWTARNYMKYRDITMEPKGSYVEFIVLSPFFTQVAYSNSSIGVGTWISLHYLVYLSLFHHILSLFWSFGILHQWDPIRLTLMVASKTALLVVEGLLEIRLVSVFELSTLSMVIALSWTIQDTLRHIRHLLVFYRDTVTHIYREGNQVADSLASEG
ncbi:RNase H domain-containing protein [Abeliophyllum distichum]|uniref:RNase H domain-containing protein n=1 Tax=Abeliophyllum distichum TaxID=126358 RepID=A0ABD1UNG5_9LAMI